MNLNNANEGFGCRLIIGLMNADDEDNTRWTVCTYTTAVDSWLVAVNNYQLNHPSKQVT